MEGLGFHEQSIGTHGANNHENKMTQLYVETSKFILQWQM